MGIASSCFTVKIHEAISSECVFFSIPQGVLYVRSDQMKGHL